MTIGYVDLGLTPGPWPQIATIMAALVVALTVTPLVRRLAVQFGFTDRPSERRDALLKPRLGGLGLYLAFVVPILATIPFVPRPDQELIHITGLIVGATIVVVAGAIDDRWELGPLPQFGFQLLAALAAILSGIKISQVPNPFGTDFVDPNILLPDYVAIPFTLFWFLGAMNVLNWIDGLDGLAAGISGIAALILFIHSSDQGHYSLTILPLALMGGALGFLPYNFRPGRPAAITLGTTGSMFLGYVLAYLAIIGGTKGATFLLVLGVPIFDALWLVLRRLRRGQSPFSGDRSHLHHLLRDNGFSSWQIVALVYLICGVFGALSLLPSRLLKLPAIGALALVLLALVVVLGRRRREPG